MKNTNNINKLLYIILIATTVSASDAGDEPGAGARTAPANPFAGRCWALGTDLSGTSHRPPHAGPATPAPGHYTQGAWDTIEARVRAYFDNGGSADPFFPLGAGMIGLGRPAEELTPENIEKWKRDAVMRHIASKRSVMVFDETRLTKEDDLAFLPWAHVGERPRYERTPGESFSGWRRRELINWHTALRSARG